MKVKVEVDVDTETGDYEVVFHSEKPGQLIDAMSVMQAMRRIFTDVEPKLGTAGEA